MPPSNIAAALTRVERILERKPEAGMSDDAAAAARWCGGTRVVTRHGNGTEVATDLPAELGGGGNEVAPGWLFRAGLASCLCTAIVLHAARRGIVLDRLEVGASSVSDTRGLLGMRDRDGTAVNPGPRDVRLQVRIAATGVSEAVLRSLVDDSQRSSPVSGATCAATPIDLQVEADGPSDR